MTTPVKDFIQNYIDSHCIRAHMPGHKGRELLGFEKYDITETDGADVLYAATGILAESMNNAASLFGTEKTVYSAEGSSLSIRAMLYLCTLYAKKKGVRTHILAGRNAHKVFVMSAALLDIDVTWLYGKGGGITGCDITASELDKILSDTENKPCAVYITSPDYLGNIADIRGIAKVCEKHNLLLIVDNAHGAYLNFLSENQHPIHLGAHICCDSAHKTLPALTGAGYLHISKKAPPIFSENAVKAMTLFASTSPSYLILQSLDAVNGYLSDGYRERLSGYCKKTARLSERLADIGIKNISKEPLKLTFAPKEYGYTGIALAAYLKECGIVCEFYDPDYTVLMLTPESEDDALERIYDAMSALPKKDKIYEKPPCINAAKVGMSIRDAVFAPTEKIPLCESYGRIYAGICASCPPAVPVAVCGEIIDNDTIDLLRYYGEETVDAVTEY